MIIIIGSSDDALYNKDLDINLWKTISEILINEKELLNRTIEYWSRNDTEDLEDCFYITRFIRAVRSQIR